MGDDLMKTINIQDYLGTGMIDGNTFGALGTAISMPITTVSNVSAGKHFDMEGFLDTRSFNKFTVDHKLQEHEFMKLKETVPTFADEIKENLSKNLARDIIKKATFTKKKDVDADVHHFIGRVWVFTEDELKNLINEARNA
jgi:hypothetical protein